MKAWHKKKLNPVSIKPEEAFTGPHLLDSEVEPFCRRVSEFGKIVQGLVSFRVDDQKEAIRRADVFLHGGSGDGSFDYVDPAPQYNQIKATECGDGPAPKVAEESHGTDKKEEISAAATIHKDDVLLEDCSDDDVDQPKATTSTTKATKLEDFEKGGADPKSNSRKKCEENTDDSVQSAEQGILDLLHLPSKEEARSKKRDDAILRKEKSDRYRKKGTIAFRDKAFADAVLNYTKAIELIPEDSYMYMNRAQAYLRVGLPGMALEDLITAVEMNPKSLKAHLLQARAYFSLSLPNKTKEFLERVKKDFHSKLGMIQAFEKDLFDLKMERHLETSEEARQREEIRKLNRIPMLTDLEEKWQKLGRHQLLEVECLKSDLDEDKA